MGGVVGGLCGGAAYRVVVVPSKFGEWMRLNSVSDDELENEKGFAGRKASEAPAYIQDFALLKIKCGRK